jgi:hypothetical protein
MKPNHAAERERAVAHVSDAADRVYAKQGDRRQIVPPPQPVGTPPPDPLSGVESYPLSPATVSYPASADLAKVTAAIDEVDSSPWWRVKHLQELLLPFSS